MIIDICFFLDLNQKNGKKDDFTTDSDGIETEEENEDESRIINKEITNAQSELDDEFFSLEEFNKMTEKDRAFDMGPHDDNEEDLDDDIDYFSGS